MESGELMLRVHDECSVFNVYKPMHPSSDTKSCMKIETSELSNQKPPDKLLQVPPLCMSVNEEQKVKPRTDSITIKLNKGPKKEYKCGQGQKGWAEKLPQSQQVSGVPYFSEIVGNNNKACIIADASKKNFDPP
ncbi:hypothetical protein PIB30_092726 [Stylosanthes scabra]|uniref:Uncharacterized protein n=1 Tax=Stylosanthes scabra TaxID=79078 RepID=A0ABU6RVH4_9FABA|nr:hypothetical protein [Stylosanthes scabra]